MSLVLLLKNTIKRTRLPWLINACRYLYLCCSGQKLHSVSRKIDKAAKQLVIPKDITDKVSIICCVWNTDLHFLKAMLDSVIDQTYPNWELCINNCSDIEHNAVQELLNQYKKKDVRIKIQKNQNRGIAENSNAAVRNANGNFLFLLDHDDWLPPHALGRLLMCQKETGADFIYADECIYFMKHQIGKLSHKGKFSMSILRTNNFINHPVLIRKELFDQINGFRSGFEGSQDYDLYLRLLENTTKVQYVPEALYYWRINEFSFSQKDLQRCIESGKKVLEEHLERMGISGRVIAKNNCPRFEILSE